MTPPGPRPNREPRRDAGSSTSGVPSLVEFANNAIKSGLLSEEDLRAAQQASGNQSPPRDSTELARLLIRQGKLTHYQARKLFAGVTRGFFLGGARIIRDLGEGGMGKVFLAVRESDGQRVAIKVLPPRKAFEDPQALARFRRETELSRRVEHPNLVRTLAVGSEGGVNFMVIEYVPGDSLYHLVVGPHRSPWRVTDTARYFLKVLDGLQAAHDAGLIHRDIKPSNLMVTPEGDAKILDLGLARALGEAESDGARLTRDNAVIGTLDYASPEQLADAATADARSDLYSIGCSLYFTLSGQPPFPGGDVINKIYKQRMEDPPPLERLVPNIPSSFAALVRKLMAKNPDHRYQSARELAADLARWTDPAVVRALLGSRGESARAFRLPPPELEEEDLRFLDSPSGGPPNHSIHRQIGDAAPAPAPRNLRAMPPRSAQRHDHEENEATDDTPEGLPAWILWIIAMLACVLAAVLVFLAAQSH